MTIAEASNLIAQALESGRISRDAAAAAQAAIRLRVYCGMRMTPRDRASIIINRFGLTA